MKDIKNKKNQNQDQEYKKKHEGQMQHDTIISTVYLPVKSPGTPHPNISEGTTGVSATATPTATDFSVSPPIDMAIATLKAASSSSSSSIG